MNLFYNMCMISSESAKEYYKYKKFLQTSEYYLRSEWEGSFQSFNRHKQISDILGIDIEEEYNELIGSHKENIQKIVDTYWDRSIITELPHNDFFYILESDWGDKYVKSVSVAVGTIEFDSFGEIADYIDKNLNNNHFILYTYVNAGRHRLRFAFLDKKDYPTLK
jgi:hypothetical protein